MLRILWSMFLISVLALVLHAGMTSPDRDRKKIDPPAAPKAEAIPQLAGETNWGKVEQVGRQLKITGHPFWEALGEVKDNGEVHLLWTLLSSGEPAPSIYKVVPGERGPELHGLWNMGANLSVDEKGKIVGMDRPDRVYRLPPAEPDVELRGTTGI